MKQSSALGLDTFLLCLEARVKVIKRLHTKHMSFLGKMFLLQKTNNSWSPRGLITLQRKVFCSTIEYSNVRILQVAEL